MAYENKPNQGKSWRTTKEDKMKHHQRLKGQDWYDKKNDDEKREVLDKWSGNLSVRITEETIAKIKEGTGGEIVQNMKFSLQEGKSLKGKAQMSIRLWEPNS